MSSILVAHASKHGATQDIAERIAAILTAAGHQAHDLPVGAVTDIDSYDAFVIGSAVYIGSWLKEATAFVRHNQAVLVSRPVWLFSSGPLGTTAVDAKGRDVLVTSRPRQFAEFEQTISPRDVKVFFGALDPDKLTLLECLPRRFPGGRALMPEGDFRDWEAIETWADGIAQELLALKEVATPHAEPTTVR